MHPNSLNRVQLCTTLWTVAHQAPLSMEFSRQEYWKRLPCPTSGDIPNPGIEPASWHLLPLLHWQEGSLPLMPSVKPDSAILLSIYPEKTINWKDT